MARKVFISVLGATFYEQCIYGCIDEDGNIIFKSSPTRFIQQATLEYLNECNWNDIDKNNTDKQEKIAYILTTETAKANNWDKTITERVHFSRGKEAYEGLESVLAKMQLDFKYESLNIPNGNNELEMWNIFNKLYEKLEDGDELYFDLTHSFRYIPMLVLVLGNYAKFLKKVSIRSITYGNLEASKSRNDAIAPIIDLLPLTTLQDWTFAAADYLKNGKADRFFELASDYKAAIFKGMKKGDTGRAKEVEELAKSLQVVADDFHVCRCNEIIQKQHLSNLKNKLESVQNTVIEPVNPVIEKLKEAFQPFAEYESEEEQQCKDGFAAAWWCLCHNLHQQAATIVQESIVSLICNRHNINITSKDERKYVNEAFAITYTLNASDTLDDTRKDMEKYVNENKMVSKLMKDDIITDKELYRSFKVITDERNDINHGGMRPAPHQIKTIKRNVTKATLSFIKKLSPSLWKHILHMKENDSITKDIMQEIDKMYK